MGQFRCASRRGCRLKPAFQAVWAVREGEVSRGVKRHLKLGHLATLKTGPPPRVAQVHVVASFALAPGELGPLVKPLKRPLRRFSRSR